MFLSWLSGSVSSLIHGHKGWYHHTENTLQTYGYVEFETEAEVKGAIQGLRDGKYAATPIYPGHQPPVLTRIPLGSVPLAGISE